MKETNCSHKYIASKYNDPERILQSIDQIDHVIRTTTDVKILLDIVISEVLTIFKSDRAWLFYPCNPDIDSFDVSIESTVPEYPGAKALNKSVPMTQDMADYCYRALSKLNQPHIDPSAGSVINNDIAIQFHVKTIMYIALQPQAGDAWMFGLHQCKYDRVWTDDDRKLFQLIGNRITNCIENVIYLNQLRESEIKFRTLFERSNDGILVADLITKKFILCNKKICEMLGYEFHELMELSVYYIHPVKDLPQVIDIFEKQSRKELRTAEFRVLRKDNSVFYAEISSAPIILDGKPYLMGTFRDITEKKRSAQRTADALYMLSIAEKVAKMGSWRWDPYTNKVEWSDNMYLLHGIESSFIPTLHHAISYTHPDDIDIVNKCVEYILSEKKSAPPVEYRIVTPQNQIVWVQGTSQVMLDKKGNIAEIIGTIRDITERKISEEALKESESRYNEMARHINEVFWLFDWKKQKIIHASYAYERIWGRSVKALLKDFNEWRNSIHPEDRAYAEAFFQKIFETGNDAIREYRIVRPDGSIRWIADNGVGIKDQTGKVIRINGVAKDITAQKQAEAEIAKRESILFSIHRAAPVGIGILDIERRFQWPNHQLSKITGYSTKELEGMPTSALYETKEEYLRVAETKKQNLAQSGISNIETRWIRKDGQKINVILSASYINPGEPAEGLIGTALEIRHHSNLLKSSYHL